MWVVLNFVFFFLGEFHCTLFPMILCSFIWEVLIGVDVVYGLKCFCGLDFISLFFRVINGMTLVSSFFLF